MANVLMKYTWPWAVAATVLVVGFLYWLHAESTSLETGLVVADTLEEGALPEVADTAFVRDPSQFSRERILLRPVTVVERIGRAAITVDLPGLENYPMILERSVVEGDLTIVGGDFLAVAGQVYALNDSLLDVYMQRGLFQPESRASLEGHSTFFLVDSLDFVFPGELEEEAAGGS